MKYDMDLQWKTGVNHQWPDAPYRLPIRDAPGAVADDFFPDVSSSRTPCSGPQGPVLDGVLLCELGADEVDTPAGKSSLVVSSVIFTPGGGTTGNNAAGGTVNAEEACLTGRIGSWRRWIRPDQNAQVRPEA